MDTEGTIPIYVSHEEILAAATAPGFRSAYHTIRHELGERPYRAALNRFDSLTFDPCIAAGLCRGTARASLDIGTQTALGFALLAITKDEWQYLMPSLEEWLLSTEHRGVTLTSRDDTRGAWVVFYDTTQFNEKMEAINHTQTEPAGGPASAAPEAVISPRRTFRRFRTI